MTTIFDKISLSELALIEQGYSNAQMAHHRNRCGYCHRTNGGRISRMAISHQPRTIKARSAKQEDWVHAYN